MPENKIMTYNLPHPLDRPHQQEALDWIMASKKRYNIICAPTGSGKSAWVAAASRSIKVLVLTKTKSLQSENYAGIYGLDALYGESNYPCENDNPLTRMTNWTANDCDERDCECPYQKQMRLCEISQRVSLNYAKYLSSRQFVKNASPKLLFLDEGHNLPDIVSEWIGITLRWNNEFIQWANAPKKTKQLEYSEAMGIFQQCIQFVNDHKPTKKDLIKWRKWKRLFLKIKTVNEILTGSDLTDWYYEIDEEKLLIKPLTAKYHFKSLFNAPKIVMMSATVQPSIINQLGIDESEMAFMEVPNVWPIPTRIIYDLNAPKMNWKSSDGDKQKQVKLIGNVLKPNKSGIIHVMSESQAKNLQYNLCKFRHLQFWIAEKGIGTEKQLAEWYQIREPGLYWISYNCHEGVSLGNEDICIVAKTPWGDIGPNYEKARMTYDNKQYKIRAAQLLEQSFGRIWRGKPEHYTGIKKAYIADGSWKRLKPYLSEDFKKRIRSYNGR